MKNNIGKNLFIAMSIGALVSNSLVAFGGGGAGIPNADMLDYDVSKLNAAWQTATTDLEKNKNALINDKFGCEKNPPDTAACARAKTEQITFDAETACINAVGKDMKNPAGLLVQGPDDVSRLRAEQTAAKAALSSTDIKGCLKTQSNCQGLASSQSGLASVGASRTGAASSALASHAGDALNAFPANSTDQDCKSLREATYKIAGDATQVAGAQGMSVQEMAALGQMAQSTMGALASLAKSAAAAAGSSISGPTAPTDPTATSMSSPNIAGGTMGGVSTPTTTGTVANTGAAGGGASMPNFGMPSDNSAAGTGSGQAVGTMGANSALGAAAGGAGASPTSTPDSKATLAGSLSATSTNPLTPLDETMGAAGGGGSSMLGLKSSKEFDAGLPPPDLGGAKDPGALADAGLDRGLASENAGSDLVAQNDVNSANTNLFDVMNSKMRDMARRGAL